MSISPESLLKEIREAVAKKKTETGERNAVVRVLAKHGAYKTPKIETGRFGNGSTFRVYIWDTKWGDLVLSSGPSVEGEVQYAEKSQVTDAPDGFYHVLEKAKGTSKITSAMKKIAARQDVTGSTTVSKPKRKAAPKKKAAPKRKKAKVGASKEMAAARAREQAEVLAQNEAEMKAANLIARYQERGSTEFLQDVLQMYHGGDEYESSAARSAINEFAQEAVPGVRIQESMDVFAHAAEGKLSDEKIASYYIENRADVNQIVDNEILRLVEAEEMAMVEEEPETMSAAERIAAAIRDAVAAI